MCFYYVQMGHLWRSPYFERCSMDPMTTVLENGVSQKARFYFPAFRFTKQQNETISTYYLHCITRLCEPSTCSTFKAASQPQHPFKAEIFASTKILLNSHVSIWFDAQQCNRKKRSAETTVNQGGISMTPELTVVIRTKTEYGTKLKKYLHSLMMAPHRINKAAFQSDNTVTQTPQSTHITQMVVICAVKV